MVVRIGAASPVTVAAFAALPRERFVPPAKQTLAYMDAGLEVWLSIDGAPPRFLLAPVVLEKSAD